MAATSINEASQEIRIRNQDVPERVAANRLPALVRVDQSAESCPFEPHRGLVEDAGHPLPVKQLGEIPVVDAGSGASVHQPGLHVREVPAEVRTQ